MVKEKCGNSQIEKDTHATGHVKGEEAYKEMVAVQSPVPEGKEIVQDEIHGHCNKSCTGL